MHEKIDVVRILLEIIRVGLLRIRMFGDSGLATACRIEADHLHNIPELISSPSMARVKFYYEVEREAFLDATSSNVDSFTELWENLRKAIEAGA